jgi:hypothetical protein
VTETKLSDLVLAASVVAAQALAALAVRAIQLSSPAEWMREAGLIGPAM